MREGEFARFLFAILLIGFFWGVFYAKKRHFLLFFSAILRFADCCCVREKAFCGRNYAVARFGVLLLVICFFVCGDVLQ